MSSALLYSFIRMRIEIPECRRCLFCVPLRYGICIFGYINLLFSILLLTLELYLGWGYSPTTPSLHLYRGTAMYTQIWFSVVLNTMEILFNIVLLIGAHTRRKQFLRAYYYYGITTTCATFVALLVLKLYDETDISFRYQLVNIVLDLSGFLVHIYLLCLIRSELSKPRYRSGVAFVNHVAEIISPPPWGDGRNPL